MIYSGRSKQPVPHLPIWKQDGAVVIERYIESFVDRNGNKAVLSMVSWKDKKG